MILIFTSIIFSFLVPIWERNRESEFSRIVCLVHCGVGLEKIFFEFKYFWLFQFYCCCCCITFSFHKHKLLGFFAMVKGLSSYWSFWWISDQNLGTGCQLNAFLLVIETFQAFLLVKTDNPTLVKCHLVQGCPRRDRHNLKKQKFLGCFF